MFDYSEDGDREFTDVGPDVAIKADHSYEPTRSLCARGEKCRARRSAGIQADEVGNKFLDHFFVIVGIRKCL